MTYEYAVKLIGCQTNNLRKVNGAKFEFGDFEYRLTYEGGFAAFVAIDRRKIGTRNFKYFSGFGAFGCWTAGQVMEKAMEKIKSKVA